MTKYDPTEARKILEGTLEERVVNYAELKYGKGKEVAAELSTESYRKGYEDPIQTLDKICGKPKIVDAEFESIDGLIHYVSKPSMLKVAVKGTLNLVDKTCWYYPILGALPRKYQEKIAGRLGDNSDNYSKSNMAAELVGASALGYSIAGISGAVAGGAISFVHSFLRYGSALVGSWTAGNVLITLPMYATLYSIAAVKAVKNAITESYTSALQQEQQKLLPPPTKKKRKKNIRVVEQKQKKVMTPGGEQSVEDLEEEPEEKKRRLFL